MYSLNFLSKNEYGNQTLDERIFRKIYNTVFDQSADFIHPEDNATFASDVIQELGLTQFKLPQRDSILWYRYNYLFNYCSEKVDVRSAYLEKFDDSVFGNETRENVAKYLSQKTDGAVFTYYSVSSDTEGVYKYNVKAGEVKIASFSICEKKTEGETAPEAEEKPAKKTSSKKTAEKKTAAKKTTTKKTTTRKTKKEGAE